MTDFSTWDRKVLEQIASEMVQKILDLEDEINELRNADVLEKQIEQKCGEYAKSKGVLHLKFTSPNHAAMPDRLLLAEIPPIFRDILANYVRFVEYKREGQKPTPAQEREHARLRALGFMVEVIDHVEDGTAVIDSMGG